MVCDAARIALRKTIPRPMKTRSTLGTSSTQIGMLITCIGGIYEELEVYI